MLVNLRVTFAYVPYHEMGCVPHAAVNLGVYTCVLALLGVFIGNLIIQCNLVTQDVISLHFHYNEIGIKSVIRDVGFL